MTYDQYQQLYGEAKEQIAARVAKIQPTAGNGASVIGMGIAIEVPVAEEAEAVDLTQYYILSWLGPAGSFASAGKHVVGRFGEVNASFNFDMGAQDPFGPFNPALVQPLILTLQFLSFDSGVYDYAFPVRATLVQYSQDVTIDGVYNENPIRTVNVDLRRDPVTTTFYYDLTDYRPQIVRITKVIKI
jgi:hypothetical protein